MPENYTVIDNYGIRVIVARIVSSPQGEEGGVSEKCYVIGDDVTRYIKTVLSPHESIAQCSVSRPPAGEGGNNISNSSPRYSSFTSSNPDDIDFYRT